MNGNFSKSLHKLLMALLALGLLGLPLMAQDDPEDPAEPGSPVEAPAPQDPAEDPVDEEQPEQEQPEQEQDMDDPETSQDAPAAVPAPAFGASRMVDVPVEAGMREFSESAWVRVLNLSPNTENIDFNLIPADTDAPVPDMPEFMQDVEYEGHGTYVELPAGTYELDLYRTGEDDRESFNLNSGRFYTLAVIGLELPPEAEADQQDEGGFMGWLRGVFGGDDGSDAYTLDTMLLEDDLFQTTLENESLVRVVNAAPGTEQVTLAVTGESGTLTGSAAYGNATGTNRINAAEFSGPLELRLGGSRAATIDLEDVTFTPGTVNTVFLVGTPVEDAPLRAIVLSTAAFGDSF